MKKEEMELPLYMAVTADKYELPLCVSPYPEEIAAYSGRSKQAVACAITRRTDGSQIGMRFVRVLPDPEAEA